MHKTGSKFRVDYTLALGGVAVGICLVLFPPQSRTAAVFWFIVLFGVLTYPALHFSDWAVPFGKRIIRPITILLLLVVITVVGYEVWPRPDGARVDVVNVVPLPKSSDPSSFSTVSVFYKNNGTLPAQDVTHRTVMVDPDRQLSREEEEDFLRTADAVESQPSNGSEVQPGTDAKQFFSDPDRPGERSDRLTAEWPQILSGSKRLYLFIVFKYRDRRMSNNTGRVTEFCGYFVHTLEAWHKCGRNRVFDQTVP